MCIPFFTADHQGGLSSDRGTAIEYLRPGNLEGMTRPLWSNSQAVSFDLDDHRAAADQEWSFKDEFLFALQDVCHGDVGLCQFFDVVPSRGLPRAALELCPAEQDVLFRAFL